MSAFAVFKRDMIVERTQDGKAIAKLREVNQKDIKESKYKS